jgi:hypothetical protein
MGLFVFPTLTSSRALAQPQKSPGIPRDFWISFAASQHLSTAVNQIPWKERHNGAQDKFTPEREHETRDIPGH